MSAEKPEKVHIGNRKFKLDKIYLPDYGIAFKQWLLRTAAMGIEGITAEYESILAEDTPPAMCATEFYKNMDQNRYRTIICTDVNRIAIKPTPPKTQEQYIHANFIHGYKQRNAYILTQAPTLDSSINFWKMIWQEKCQIIVQICRFKEQEESICYQYWPSTQFKGKQFGSVKVTNLDNEKLSEESEITCLELKHVKTEERRIILHMLYIGWLDCQGLSLSPSFHSLVESVSDIKRRYASKAEWWSGGPQGPPIVVHCNSGVGRSAIFVAFDICRKKIQDTGKVDTVQLCVALRKQRAMGIQRLDHYFALSMLLIEQGHIDRLFNIENLDKAHFDPSTIIKAYGANVTTDDQKKTEKAKSKIAGRPTKSCPRLPENPASPAPNNQFQAQQSNFPSPEYEHVVAIKSAFDSFFTNQHNKLYDSFNRDMKAHEVKFDLITKANNADNALSEGSAANRTNKSAAQHERRSQHQSLGARNPKHNPKQSK